MRNSYIKKLYLLNLLLFFTTCFSQIENDSAYEFAKDIFIKEYSPQDYKRYEEEIISLPNRSLKYGDKTLVFLDSDATYHTIFSLGIFYPNIITGDYPAYLKSKAELSKMTDKEIMFYNITRTDSLSISNVRELQLMASNPKIKRFAFWLYRKGMMNPTEYYFELENKKATNKTPLSKFIENARLTFIYKGTIII